MNVGGSAVPSRNSNRSDDHTSQLTCEICLVPNTTATRFWVGLRTIIKIDHITGRIKAMSKNSLMNMLF